MEKDRNGTQDINPKNLSPNIKSAAITPDATIAPDVETTSVQRPRQLDRKCNHKVVVKSDGSDVAWKHNLKATGVTRKLSGEPTLGNQ